MKFNRYLISFAVSVAATGAFAQGALSNPSPSQESQGKTRAQVVAETREAMRLGLIVQGETEYPMAITKAQAEQIHQAGLAAIASK